MQKMIFFGSDQYSAVVLSHLLENRDTGIPGNLVVVTDHRTDPLPVEQLALKHHLNVFPYPTLPDLIEPGTIGLCASFDHLLPPSVIDRFGGNLYNLHPSLLPQYRNVSPVQYALALGDKVTGITLFRISSGIDNGEIIAQAEETILENDTTPTLTPRLFEKGAELLQGSVLCNESTPYKERTLVSRSPGNRETCLTGRQAGKLIFTHRLTRDSGYIEWPVLEMLLHNHLPDISATKNELLRLRLTHNPAGNILADLLRALTPWPGVWSNVPTKKGDLRITLETISPEITVKIAGKPRPISLTDFLNNYL